MKALLHLAAPAAAALLGSTAAAQAPLDFVIDSSTTQFTYSGTTSLGPIVGNPPNFSLSGDVGVLLSGMAGATPTDISLTGTGTALAAPDIMAEIPNPVPFFPALAQISITNLGLQLSSANAAVDASGNFTIQVVTTTTSGTLTVTPLGGTASVTDLTGSQSLPQTFAANVSVMGTNTRVSGPLNISFAFTDAGSGLSATLNLVGDFAADYDAVTPTNHCTSNTNSSGAVASLTASGTPSLTAADLVLNAANVPSNQFMLFILSDTPDSIPGFAGSQGTLCVGGSIIRLNNFLQNSGPAGTASLAVPFGSIPGTTVDIGETWYFQAWFRDVNGGMATSNTTDGLQVTFAP